LATVGFAFAAFDDVRSDFCADLAVGFVAGAAVDFAADFCADLVAADLVAADLVAADLVAADLVAADLVAADFAAGFSADLAAAPAEPLRPGFTADLPGDFADRFPRGVAVGSLPVLAGGGVAAEAVAFVRAGEVRADFLAEFELAADADTSADRLPVRPEAGLGGVTRNSLRGGTTANVAWRGRLGVSWRSCPITLRRIDPGLRCGTSPPG
jgi:hypothetical protein